MSIDNVGTRYGALFFNVAGYPKSKIYRPAGSNDMYFYVYGAAKNAMMIDYENANIGMGTTSPNYKLDVHGTIRAEEIVVELFTPDYVFGSNYDLWSLEEVDRFVKQNHHLPGVPSAVDVEEMGMPLGSFTGTPLQKVEELTPQLHKSYWNKLM